MKSVGDTAPLSRRAYVSPQVILIAATFGLIGMSTQLADMRVPILPAYGISADSREIFVVLGAVFSGPVGGALTGCISALYSPFTNPLLHWFVLLAHTLAGCAIGWIYGNVDNRERVRRFALDWFKCILGYYLVLVATFTLCSGLFVPSLLQGIAGPGIPVWRGYLILVGSALPEAIFILVITLVVMLALPVHYRVPIWKRLAAVDKKIGP